MGVNGFVGQPLTYVCLRAPGQAPGTYNTITTTTDCAGHQTVNYEYIPANGPGISRNNNNNCNGGSANTLSNAMTTTNNNNNAGGGGTLTNNNMNSGGTITNNNGLADAAARRQPVVGSLVAFAPAPGPMADAALAPSAAAAGAAADPAMGAPSTITNNNMNGGAAASNPNLVGFTPAVPAQQTGGVTNNNMNGPQAGTVNNNNNGPVATSTGATQPQPPPAGTYNTITTIADCQTGTRVEYTYEPANGPGITRNNQNTCNSPGSNTITNNNG
ncbi:hypothetical protein COCSUDRAFT_67059 [Coccomyxa subellipsoidea C-169]|uniref:Uncharacterized protein n=1 Tax=Coccomyxa subellipsoidea (strain C-169) TaxID=574566 RepID=I0YRP8_COCSC|nr:hypothetical protein COCSUDRAFT_67059 [Coccomyxa subellipsoidea C-169]EIE21067.1 hypothetical protein COCSUDRAFT_67059 [Coccomyxa subellipsoidea C-169]|eukprot:XP_005645611.1 hypothetical protein COCSUDRAFT_67059 [Coccomyxa subellipsoidea C-169]